MPSLGSALNRLTQANEYLLLRDSEGHVAFVEVSPEIKPEIPSQYFRRKLISLYQLPNPWDWRLYGYEERLISTLEHFRLNDS
jgi:predicted transposase YdaD